MDLGHVPHTVRRTQTASDERAVALSDSLGFGGHDVTLCPQVARAPRPRARCC
jgi:hypothetical protein